MTSSLLLLIGPHWLFIMHLFLSSSNIMAAVNLLSPPPQVRQVGTVEEWLGMLQLDYLAARFSGYSLQKLSNLWDVELATVRLLPPFFLPLLSPHSPPRSLFLPPPSSLHNSSFTLLPLLRTFSTHSLQFYSSVNITCCAMTSRI